jgi:hypothetical protein
MKKYVWAPNARMRGDAQLVGRELDMLQRTHGQVLTPRVVVDHARADKSALHKCFTWDDAKAAELHRENEARSIIRSIRIITDNAIDDPTPHRVFVNIDGLEGQDEQAYVPMTRVLSDPELFERARRQFLSDLQAFKRRYQEFESLVAPLLEVESVIAAMEGSNARITARH